MSQFDKRQKAAEAKFALDEQRLFKVTMRRNKLLGLWAAEKLGLSGDAVDAYAKAVIAADFDEPGHEDVFRKVFGDLTAKGLNISEHRVRRQMDDLMRTAAAEVEAEQS